MRVGIVLAKVEDVAHVGAAETVDRLVVVADHHDVAVLRGQLVHEHVLRAVGVLVLVHQHVAESIAPLVECLVIGIEELDQLHDQVVEVEAAGALQQLLVRLVDAADYLVVVAAVRVVGRPLELVLGRRDRVAQRGHRVALLVELQVVEDAPQGGARVVLIEDHEARDDADAVGVAAQDLDRGGVEGAHPHVARPLAHKVLDAAPHLLGRLVGEGDREEAVRPDLVGGDQVGDPGRQHPGLAAPGPREDKEGAVLVHDGFPLGRVEAVQQGVGVGRGGIAGGHQDRVYRWLAGDPPPATRPTRPLNSF